jgi:hypothetical protein
MDIDKLREEMVTEAQRVLDRNRVGERTKKKLNKFIAGDAHTLPDAYDLVAILYSAMTRAAPGMTRDPKFHAAYNEFIKYFFRSDRELRISP